MSRYPYPIFMEQEKCDIDLMEEWIMENKAVLTLCLKCGPNMPVDEDGCCLLCGATAEGTYVYCVEELRAAYNRLRKELEREKVRVERADAEISRLRGCAAMKGVVEAAKKVQGISDKEYISKLHDEAIVMEKEIDVLSTLLDAAEKVAIAARITTDQFFSPLNYVKPINDKMGALRDALDVYDIMRGKA